MKAYLIGITGASGSIYAVRLVEELLKRDIKIFLTATSNGKAVMKHETGLEFNEWSNGLKKQYANLIIEEIDNLFSPAASGSYKMDGTIIIPCSMGTLGEISCGITKNLLTRAADVALKEKRELIIVPRETPLNAIHLENMLKLSKMGVSLIPAMPGFYHKPETLSDVINFVVGKILDYLKIQNNLFEKWGN